MGQIGGYKLILIQDYVQEKLVTYTGQAVADSMGISVSMLSAYKKSYNPSLDVAIRVYKNEGIVLHPFSRESLEYEAKKGK